MSAPRGRVLRPYLTLLVALGAGCTPTCEQACRKLTACGFEESPRTSALECQQSCEATQRMLDRWEDPEKIEAFDEQRHCIGGSTCDEIGAGECYDPELFIF